MLINFKLKKLIFVSTILFLFSISLILIYANNIKEFNNNDSSNFNYSASLPKLQLYDYKPVLTEKLYDLGNISIIDMDTLDRGFLYRNYTYEDIKDDLNNGNLVARDFDFIFCNTIKPAKFNNTDIRERYKQIDIRYNVSLTFDYNSSASGLLMYKTNLYPAELKDVYLNGTWLPDDNYTIDGFDAFIYNYREQHKTENGTLGFTFVYDYCINLENWKINQNPNQNLILNNKSQLISVDYEYKFNIGALIITSQNMIEPAENFTLDFLFCLQDSDKLYNFEYLIGNESQDINAHKSPQNWFNGSSLANQTLISLKFTTDFTVAFKNVCHDLWAIDRLVGLDITRERIYFLEILDGPSGIYLENIQFSESYINYSQFSEVKTNFKRKANVIDLNTTEEASTSPKNGLRITAPYFIKNEVLAVIVKYQTTEFLSVVVTDHIKAPMAGLILKFYYFNQTYGTYISSARTQPIPQQITNYAGQVLLCNVPNGIYTVEVYNSLGQFLMNETADTSIASNYIYSAIIHFPTWIIIFSIIYSIILLAGIWIYLKNRDLQ